MSELLFIAALLLFAGGFVAGIMLACQEIKGSKKEKCYHNLIKLPYLKWCDYAERNIRRGKEQYQCDKCGLWLFPEEI